MSFDDAFALAQSLADQQAARTGLSHMLYAIECTVDPREENQESLRHYAERYLEATRRVAAILAEAPR